MPDHTDSARERSVQWRQLSRTLWAGRAEDGPIGTIEHGYRFLAIDTDGNLLGRHVNLPDAQAALVEHAKRPTITALLRAPAHSAA